MLPKKERLTKEDFKEVRPKIFFRGVFFDIGYFPAQVLKFSCIISKKRINTAIGRNNVKRKIYAILEKEKPHKPGYYYIYIKSEAKDTKAYQLEDEIKQAFATLN